MPDDRVHQPQTDPDLSPNDLKPSDTGEHEPTPPNDDEQPTPTEPRPLIDNEGLELDEGNDLA